MKGLLQRSALVTARFLLRALWPGSVRGVHHLEGLGPCILAPNHSSFLDPPLLQTSCDRRLVFLMTASIAEKPALRWFFRFWEVIVVPEGRAGTRALREALRALQRGEVLALFPEGRLSRDGCLNAPRPGLGWLLQMAQVPVVPVAIQGTFRAFPRKTLLPRRYPLHLRFGRPMQPPPPRAGRSEQERFLTALMGRLAEMGVPRREGAEPPE